MSNYMGYIRREIVEIFEETHGIDLSLCECRKKNGNLGNVKDYRDEVKRFQVTLDVISLLLIILIKL